MKKLVNLTVSKVSDQNVYRVVCIIIDYAINTSNVKIEKNDVHTLLALGALRFWSEMNYVDTKLIVCQINVLIYLKSLHLRLCLLYTSRCV